MNVVRISFFHLALFINATTQKADTNVTVDYFLSFFCCSFYNSLLFIRLGQPFYHELPKMSTLAALLLTASIFMYKEMYGLASLTCTAASILIILFAKNLL